MAEDHSNAGKSVLVVDDERMVLRVCRRILEREGYDVLLAGDCEQAFEYVRGANGSLDVLVCDIRMPDMQGDELARKLRDLQPDLEVIFISGHTNGDEFGEIDSQFVAKPFSAEELLGAIAVALRS